MLSISLAIYVLCGVYFSNDLNIFLAAGGVDEDTFLNAFENVPKIQV